MSVREATLNVCSSSVKLPLWAQELDNLILLRAWHPAAEPLEPQGGAVKNTKLLVDVSDSIM